MERIEIVRGPASALFGADAFLGVINIKTRTGKSLSGVTAWTGLDAGRRWAQRFRAPPPRRMRRICWSPLWGSRIRSPRAPSSSG